MEIKSKKPQRSPIFGRAFIRNFFRRKSLLLLFCLTIATITLAGIAGLSFLQGIKWHKQHRVWDLRVAISDIIKTNFDIPVNFWDSYQESIQKVQLDIKFKHLQKVSYYKHLAMEAGELNSEMKSFEFPAKLTSNDSTLDVKLSLMGTFLDHINTEKVSFKVKTKSGSAFNGMKYFSLMHPKTRYGVYEWFCHYLEMTEGLIHLRYDFVDVTLNGKHLGIFIIEEGFDKRLIESNQSREGIIVRPKENLLVAKPNKVKADKGMALQYSFLSQRFKQFWNGEIAAGKIFDIDKLAKIYAIADLMDAPHYLHPSNIRYYYNPVTGLLEPIGREFDATHFIRHGTLSGDALDPTLQTIGREYHRKIFADKNFFRTYVKQLSRMSEPEYLDQIFTAAQKPMRSIKRKIWRDHPQHHFSRSFVYETQKRIKARLNPSDPFSAYWQAKDGNVVLQLQMKNSLPLELLGVSTDGPVTLIDSPYLLSPNHKLKPGYASVALNIPEFKASTTTQTLTLHYRTLGMEQMLTKEIWPWPHGESTAIPPVFKDAQFRNFPGFIINDAAHHLVIKEGSWIIEDDLIIPPGYLVEARPGATLILRNGATFLSRSPISFIGLPKQPIIVRGDRNGGSFLVINASKQSVLQFTEFDGLSGPGISGWSLPGAVTFYESDVAISNSKFHHNQASDDALNIIRAKFTIDRSTFYSTFADAFDGDFVDGTITNSRFIDIGTSDGNGDAIDLSGSTVSITAIIANKIGDKGISAGEASRVSIKNSTIKAAKLGIASKDNSSVDANGINLENCAIGFAAYQKKAEFGPTRLMIGSYKLTNVAEKTQKDAESTITFTDQAGPDSPPPNGGT